MEEHPIKEKRKRLNSNVEAFTPNPKPQTTPEQPQSQNNDPISVLVELLMNMNLNYTFKHDFQRLNDYNDQSKIKEKFHSLKGMNEPNFDLSHYKDAAFFIMRSSNYDDIHKAMKYGIWTSTSDHNHVISEVYKQKVKEGKRVVLFFRVATENVLCGAAELVSDYVENQQFNYWWNKTMWKGIFNINWLYVKNLDLNSIMHTENNKRLYELTDGTRISQENGFMLMEFFKELACKFEYSLFKFFQLFDQREDYLIGMRSTMDVKIKLQKQERKQSNADHGLAKSRKQSHVQPLGQKYNGKRRASVPHKKIEAKEVKKDNNKKEEKEEVRRRKYSHQDHKGPSKHFVYVKKEEKPSDKDEDF